MKRLVIPLLLGLVGLAGGVGAGIAFGPDPEAASENGDEKDAAEQGGSDAGESESAEGETEFARLNNQFIVPVVQGDRVTALVVLSITLEIDAGTTEEVFAKEPKLRDRFLRVLFDHSNVGGFDAGYTQASTLSLLRRSLLDSARQTLGPLVQDVLILDIVRQET